MIIEDRGTLVTKMESVKRRAVSTPSKTKLSRTFAKVLHLRAATGVAPVDGIQKLKPLEKPEHQQPRDDDENRAPQPQIDKKPRPDKKEGGSCSKDALEALLAKLFVGISSVKAAYAQLQYAESPYDPDGIRVADQIIVSELKMVSECKRLYQKKQLDNLLSEAPMLLVESQEQKSLMKIYEVTLKRLEDQLKTKESKRSSLREELEDSKKLNRILEKKLNRSGPVSVLENFHLSGLSPKHFLAVLRQTIKSIRSFVRTILDEMKSADWDIEAAALAIEPGVSYSKADHKCFAFESFVWREMLESFQNPNFSLPNESLPERSRRNQLFFDRFVELNSTKSKDFLAQHPRSPFSKFCRVKYLGLVHPRMESAFFGNLSQRNLVNSGQFPDTKFFTMFSEMAKHVWLLHCLAFSFEPNASIFQVSRGCRFSEVYMETVVGEESLPADDHHLADDCELQVAFTIVPGFTIGKTVIQCQVYLLNSKSKSSAMDTSKS